MAKYIQAERSSAYRLSLITAAVVPEQREVLHTRIATRFDATLQLGFVAEVEKLMQRGDLHPDRRPCARRVIGRPAIYVEKSVMLTYKGVGGYAN